MSEVLFLVGPPASGKSSLRQLLSILPQPRNGSVYLNRDTEGGRVIDLLPQMIAALNEGKSVCLDNTFPTIMSRLPFIQAAQLQKATVSCMWMDTSIEDCQINTLFRMINECGRIYFSQDEMKGVNNPHVFPPAVLFKYRKEFEKPSIAEGFSKVEKVKFVRKSLGYKNKAIILDFDDTLRTVPPGSPFKFPTHPSQVTILPNRIETLQRYKQEGYILLGASNQSGIARGQVTRENAVLCYEQTCQLLGQQIDVMFCPHNVPPSCYCRKPQSGILVHFIHKYQLSPRDCLMVGDQTSDKTFAARLEINFELAENFFK
jgi:histidinol-phosphate phosphatase family protein